MTDDILIIGVGNPYRGDDGAGIAVARRLAATPPHGTMIAESSGEATALLDLFDRAPHIVVVDAGVTGQPPGTITTWTVDDILQSRKPHDPSSHGMGVAQAVGLAAALEELPRMLRVFTIEAARFDDNAPLTADVETAVTALSDALSLDPRTSALPPPQPTATR